jgi:hypothetical protein
MARMRSRPEPTREENLDSVLQDCAVCGRHMWADYENQRTITTVQNVVRLRLKVRRCPNPQCTRYHKAYRPECEGQWALPEHEFGLDILALVGTERYQRHQSVPEIHLKLQQCGVVISQRSVTNLLNRYDELVALHVGNSQRLQGLVRQQGRVILAIDGIGSPSGAEVGHEVLWVLRDCLSGEVLLARALLSSTRESLGNLLREVKAALPVPVTGVISDGQHSIRKAVADILPEAPHGLCHFHFLREAGRPIYEADRHAKKELKKRVRNIRPLERQAEQRDDEAGQLILEYCAAVRSALTDDGRPPLQAAGIRLHARLTAIAESLDRVQEKGGFPTNCSG